MFQSYAQFSCVISGPGGDNFRFVFFPTRHVEFVETCSQRFHSDSKSPSNASLGVRHSSLRQRLKRHLLRKPLKAQQLRPAMLVFLVLCIGRILNFTVLQFFLWKIELVLSQHYPMHRKLVSCYSHLGMPLCFGIVSSRHCALEGPGGSVRGRLSNARLRWATTRDFPRLKLATFGGKLG